MKNKSSYTKENAESLIKEAAELSAESFQKNLRKAAKVVAKQGPQLAAAVREYAESQAVLGEIGAVALSCVNLTPLIDLFKRAGDEGPKGNYKPVTAVAGAQLALRALELGSRAVSNVAAYCATKEGGLKVAEFACRHAANFLNFCADVPAPTESPFIAQIKADRKEEEEEESLLEEMLPESGLKSKKVKKTKG